ncbi:MAG: peptidase M16 [Rhodospirillaceae bacterium]|nr:peptidase M16 [Rhodospirillaceae bacterium]|tara:strand:- start:4603 stop:5862 length:1260 start_codon:yes stop_codon:yes gene_type:complete
MTVNVTTLANGMRVATDAIDGVESAAVGVWVDVGARDEPAEMNGMSHLLEHMAFKGTERRDARMIAQEIEDVGGHVNAYTSRENTAYYARVLQDDVPLAVDMLADILQNSTFEEEELEKERWVVMQEIAQVFDTPDDLIFDLFQERAFPDQPMGRSILGTSEGVESFQRTALMEFMAQFYTADSMILTASGAVDHDEIVRLAEEQFRGLRRSNGHVTEPAAYGGGKVERAEDVEQHHLIVGCSGYGFDDANYYPVQLFTNALGGGMSSRLFQEVREERGLAYSIYAFHSSFIDGGLFGVYAGCADEDAADVAEVIADELVRAGEGLEAEELERARTQLKAGLLMSRESTAGRCEALARQMLIFNRPMPQDEIVEKLDAVTLDDIKCCTEELLSRPLPTVATIGPKDGISQYDRIASRLN